MKTHRPWSETLDEVAPSRSGGLEEGKFFLRVLSNLFQVGSLAPTHRARSS